MNADPCICGRLRRTARALTRRYDEALAPAGMTVTQFSILRTLSRLEQPTLAELANASASVGNPIRLDGNSQLNSGSHAANGTNVNQVGQSNTGSTLTSGINNSPTTVSLGSISADGAQILNTVDTSQSINDTQVQANVDGSRACDFVETSP